MGPRSHERGNFIVLMLGHRDTLSMLQWGRVLMNAETGHCDRERDRQNRARSLQWGRVLMNAETAFMVPAVTTHLASASMGPRSHERGNATRIRGVAAISLLCFNGAAFS